MTTENLIKPANIQEQLLGKISEMRQKNLTAKQKEEIELHGGRLVRSFKIFSWRYFGIDKEQIKKLSKQEIEALFLLVSKRVSKTAICMITLGCLIPIIGWIIILPESQAITHAHSLRKLKKMLGNGFNPTQIIRSKFEIDEY